MDREGLGRRAARGMSIMLGGAALTAAAWAQVTAPAESASAPSDRARRDAEKPFRWILLHSDKPRKPREAAAAPVPAPTPTPTPATAPRPVKAATPKAPTAIEAPAPAVAAPVVAPQPAAAAPARGEPAVAPPPLPAKPLAAAAAAPTAEAGKDADPDPEADAALEPLQQVAPSFPRALMLDLRKGSVQVRFKVLPDGAVADPAVLKSTHSRLNKPVLTAIAQWKFRPVREPREAAVELGFDLD